MKYYVCTNRNMRGEVIEADTIREAMDIAEQDGDVVTYAQGRNL